MSQDQTTKPTLWVRVRNVFTNELHVKKTINASHAIDFIKMINPFSIERGFNINDEVVTIIGHGESGCEEWSFHTTDEQHEEMVKQFKEFINKDKTNKTNELKPIGEVSVDSGKLFIDAGVAFSSGYGDGRYLVYAERNDEGRIIKVVIDMDSEED